MNQYDADQTEVIQTEYPHNLLIAGAGSGKTATLVARLAWMLRNNFDFGNLTVRDMVVITFTNQAADEITRRLAKEFGAAETDTTTAHAALGYCGTLHGFCLRLIREHGHIFGFDGKSLAVLDSDGREALVKETIEFMAYKGTRKALDAELEKGPPIKKFAGRMDTVQIVAAKYFGMMRQHGVIDYDSILHYGLAIVRTLTAVPWKALFVDEFQDSGKEDFAIYRALPMSYKFFVGDPDQGIYSFRGGRIENIIALTKAPGIRTHRFERNYRSDIAICVAATNLIRHNKNRIDKITASQSKAPGSIECLRFDGAVNEINGIGSNIEALGIVNTSAILVRTRPLVQKIAEQLQGMGIPVAQRKFVERPHDWPRARALISFLANPYSDRLAYNLLLVTTDKVFADQTKARAQKEMKSLNAVSFMVQPNMTLDALPPVLTANGLSEQSTYNVMETRARLPLAASMAELDLALSRDLALQQEGTGVVVTTMHSAKGREWDNVYLPAFEQRICPLERVDSDLEEERRLAYVAITRARHRLVISFVKQRNTDFDYTLKPVSPSQFIAESGIVHNP